MSKLKITDVQVDCRELTQEQINKMCEIVEKRGFITCHLYVNDTSYYFRSIWKADNEFHIGVYNPNNTTISYDEFITLFDKHRFKAKKAIKELEQRITLLEQKLSEKDAKNSVNEAVEGLPIVVEEGMMFKDIHSDKVYEIKDISHGVIDLYILNESINVYAPLVDIEKEIKQGILILLPPTEKKESELTKGAICKFWDNDENSYEIVRYEPVSYISSNSITHKHVNILTLESFKNAKVISIDEALQLFKKQLLKGK